MPKDCDKVSQNKAIKNLNFGKVSLKKSYLCIVWECGCGCGCYLAFGIKIVYLMLVLLCKIRMYILSVNLVPK